MSTALFEEIAAVNARCDGWCELSKANALAAITLALRPKTALEVGVFGGRSLFAVALAMKHLGEGLIIAVDPWSPQASIEGATDAKNIEYWKNLDHERIYQRYCDNRDAAGLGKFINTVRSRSDDFEPPAELDFFHLDGNHEETAYRDTVRFAPKVRVGGIMVADDLGWSSGAPARGAAWLLENGFIRLYPLGTGAVFQRIK